MKLTTTLKWTALLVFMLPGFLWAHHPMGGSTPTSFAEGIISGFAHPLIGIDHFAFIISVGFLAFFLSRNYFLPAFFISGTVLGTGLHLLAFNLPAVEVIIALSVALGGLLLIWQKSTLKTGFYMALFSLAGIFHGYAYGEAVIGAEPTPIAAYLLGFAAIQYLVALGAMFLISRIAHGTNLSESVILRVSGGIVTGISIVIISDLLLAFSGIS